VRRVIDDAATYSPSITALNSGERAVLDEVLKLAGETYDDAKAMPNIEQLLTWLSLTGLIPVTHDSAPWKVGYVS